MLYFTWEDGAPKRCPDFWAYTRFWSGVGPAVRPGAEVPSRKHVAHTTLKGGDIIISTIFLGYALPVLATGDLTLFETMVREAGNPAGWMRVGDYRTLEEAEAAHQDIVAQTMARIAALKGPAS